MNLQPGDKLNHAIDRLDRAIGNWVPQRFGFRLGDVADMVTDSTGDSDEAKRWLLLGLVAERYIAAKERYEADIRRPTDAGISATDAVAGVPLEVRAGAGRPEQIEAALALQGRDGGDFAAVVFHNGVSIVGPSMRELVAELESNGLFSPDGELLVDRILLREGGVLMGPKIADLGARVIRTPDASPSLLDLLDRESLPEDGTPDTVLRAAP